MATIKAKFQASPEPNRQGKIYYQIIHRREILRIRSGISVFESEWDKETGKIVSGAKARTKILQSLALTMSRDITMLESIVQHLNSKGLEYTALQVGELFREWKAQPPFIDFMQTEIARKTALGKVSTALNYKATRNSFKIFLGTRILKADEVDSDLMESYQAWLCSRGITNNSISFYMRILRCVYNHAVKKGLTVDCDPFDNVYTGIDKTRKRAIRLSDIRKIKNLDLAMYPALERARDFFMLCFYCMGISFVDLAKLKKSDISNGRLTYKRSKTRQTISMAVNPEMVALFRKYRGAGDSLYLLDILSTRIPDVRRQYRHELNRVNIALKRVGKMAGLDTTLTTYVSRHSWASIALSKNINISTISDALGHDNESTTQIYLATLDTGNVDRANRLILSCL